MGDVRCVVSDSIVYRGYGASKEAFCEIKAKVGKTNNTMKIELQNGKTVAIAETLDEVKKLLALGGGAEAKAKRPMRFNELRCGYCHKVFKRLGKHTPKCEQKLKVAEREAKKAHLNL